MTQKSLLSFFPALIIIVFLSGCFSGPDLRIGILMDSFEHERWLKDRDLLLDKITELGGTPMMEVADGDPELQFSQAKKLIDQGVKVLIVVAVDGQKSAKIVDHAKEKGVRVIAYDRMISNCDLDYYISFDNVKVGELQGTYLSQRRAGNYFLLGGAMSDNNSMQFHEGQVNIVSKQVDIGRINILKDEYLTVWSEDLAYEKTKEWLDEVGDDIGAILAANDALASGAIRALTELDLDGSVLVSGQDAEKGAIQNIIHGKQTMTVYKPIEAIAYTAAIAAIRLAKGGELKQATKTVNNGFKDVPSILMTPITVDAYNMEYTILADNYVTQEEITEMEKTKTSKSISINDDLENEYSSDDDEIDFGFDDEEEDDDFDF